MSRQGPVFIEEPCGCRVDHGIPYRCEAHKLPIERLEKRNMGEDESVDDDTPTLRALLLAAEQERAQLQKDLAFQRTRADERVEAYIRQAGELEAARAERDGAQQWRPIETAPKEPKHNAPRIVAYWRESGWTEIVFWSDYREAWCAGDGGWGSDRWRGENAPTHWMPLPAPPEATHE
jgi:hypothetical protein